MDADRFDTLLRSFSATPSRRGALRVLGGSVISLVEWSRIQQTSAHNARPECTGIKNLKKRERCKKRARRHNAQHAGADPLPTPPDATCADGVRNGTESDVDCGGACSRCANDLACESQDDCASALCVSGVCEACGDNPDCGIDGDGACECHTHNVATQPRVCTSRIPGETSSDCDHCTGDTFCVRTGLGDFTCYKPCGAV